MKGFIKKLIPKFLLRFYHRTLAHLAAWRYGYPSRKIIVIGVTGTGGKSTVINLIGRILEEAGYKVGWTTTFNFKVAQREWMNKTKMTMLGRFGLQKLLKQMVLAGCEYALIETSSEGILQSRHEGIDYDIAVFNNLSPEHLERHGGFENYRAAKGKLFLKLKDKNKIIDGQKIRKISVVNLDDDNADYFLKFSADEKWGFTASNAEKQSIKIIKGENIKINNNGTEFSVKEQSFSLNLLGKFNAANALAAVTVALSQDVDLDVCAKGLAKVKNMAGRMEAVAKSPFKVVVDYAHTPDELEKVYQTLKTENQRFICVL
ncbi:MAG: Mur ligase family protein, partial [Patescibacteria group bacterium]|nr:Mur ligase family protein [Patescibacteria group bacterium]